MASHLRLAIIGLRISTVLYALLFIAFMTLGLIGQSEAGFPKWIWFLFAVVALPFVFLPEILIVYLKRGKYWAWIGGIMVGALYTPSLFLPLGIMILIGLLAEDTRAAFLPKKTNAEQRDGSS